MKKVKCSYDVPEEDVQKLMSTPIDVVKFTFYNPVDMIVRLLALSPIGARVENMALFPEDCDVLHDFCNGGRLRRIQDTLPAGASVLTAVLFF